MKKYLPLLLLLGGGVGFYYWRKGSAAKKLIVNLIDLKFDKATGLALPQLTAYFRIINQTNTPLVLSSLTGEIFINDTAISTVANQSNTIIPATQSITFPVKINTSIFSAAQTIFNFFKTKQKLKIQFKGNANSEGLVLPITNTLFIQS